MSEKLGHPRKNSRPHLSQKYDKFRTLINRGVSNRDAIACKSAHISRLIAKYMGFVYVGIVNDLIFNFFKDK